MGDDLLQVVPGRIGHSVCLGIADAVEDTPFSRIVCRQGELGQFMAAGVVAEHLLQADQVLQTGLDILPGVCQVLDFVQAGRSRHDLHQTQRAARGAGFYVEMGFLPDDGGQDAPVPSDLGGGFFQDFIVGGRLGVGLAGFCPGNRIRGDGKTCDDILVFFRLHKMGEEEPRCPSERFLLAGGQPGGPVFHRDAFEKLCGQRVRARPGQEVDAPVGEGIRPILAWPAEPDFSMAVIPGGEKGQHLVLEADRIGNPV